MTLKSLLIDSKLHIKLKQLALDKRISLKSLTHEALTQITKGK